jgi:phenylalanyl-tRNA synthetase beta chain
MKVTLSWLKDFVDIGVSAQELSALLTMIGLEVTSMENIGSDDYLFDIEVTPNRPDCLSVLGLAREVGLVLNKKTDHPKIVFLPRTSAASIKETEFDIEIENGEDCPRYIGRVLLDLKIKESPEFIKDRLNKLGVRSINNVVDITNYLLLQLGQPMHVFDYDKIKDRKIIVRRAKKGEKIITIDEVERELTPEDLVIADSKRPLALAGIMGGLETELSSKTKNVLLESAYFNPLLVRAAARRQGLTTEASYRFERGVDFVMADTASKSAVDLIRKYGSRESAGKTTVVVDKAKDLIKKQIPLSYKVVLNLKDIEKKLGITPSSFWIRQAVKGLGAELLSISKERIKISSPSYRRDLQTSIDYIEELARIYGYNNIPSGELPELWVSNERCLKDFDDSVFQDRVRDYLVREGLHETINYALLSEEEAGQTGCANMIRLDNPLVSSYSVLRPSLLPSLFKAVSYNFNRTNYNLALFELGRTYTYSEGQPQESRVAGIALSGIKYRDCFGKELKYSFFNLKAIFERFLDSFGISNYKITADQNRLYSEVCSAKIMLDGEQLASLGEASEEIRDYYNLKHDVFIGELLLDNLARLQREGFQYKAISQYPAIERDISLILPQNITAAEVISKIKDRDSLITKTEVIDVYQGKQIGAGKKSLAVRVQFQSLERTLKDEEVDVIETDIKDILSKELSSQIRS